jgi:hypothetical protein
MLNWLRKLWPRSESAAASPRSDAGFTRPATWEDVVAVVRLLERYRVRYIVSACELVTN